MAASSCTASLLMLFSRFESECFRGNAIGVVGDLLAIFLREFMGRVRVKRAASVETRSASATPVATVLSTFSSDTDGFRSSGFEQDLSLSQTPTASTMTKCVLCLASGVTPCSVSVSTTRQPRPFICSK